MNNDPLAEAFREGRRNGLAIAAIASSAVAFVSLLGIEKAALALMLACLAIRGTSPGSPQRRLALVAIGLAALYVVTFVVIMVLFHDRVVELVRLLQQMS